MIMSNEDLILRLAEVKISTRKSSPKPAIGCEKKMETSRRPTPPSTSSLVASDAVPKMSTVRMAVMTPSVL